MTTAHLHAQGLTSTGIRQLVASGELRRLRRGVYEFVRHGEQLTPEERHRRLIDAVVLQRPDVVLSHVSAAVVHGLPLPVKALTRVHVLQAATRWGTKRTESLFLHRIPHEASFVEVDGCRATPLDRTVLDLIRALDPHDGVAVADRALAQGLAKETLLALMDREPGRRGNARARQIIEFANPAAESAGESWARWALARAGLPAPELQVRFFDPSTGREVARSDFYWRDQRVVGEFDGETKYGRLLSPGQTTTEAVLAEKRREEGLRRLGEWVVRFVTEDLWQLDRLRQIVLSGFSFARP